MGRSIFREPVGDSARVLAINALNGVLNDIRWEKEFVAAMMIRTSTKTDDIHNQSPEFIMFHNRMKKLKESYRQYVSAIRNLKKAR